MRLDRSIKSKRTKASLLQYIKELEEADAHVLERKDDPSKQRTTPSNNYNVILKFDKEGVFISERKLRFAFAPKSTDNSLRVHRKGGSLCRIQHFLDNEEMHLQEYYDEWGDWKLSVSYRKGKINKIQYPTHRTLKL